MKYIENINLQKKVLENENEELKSRISEMMNERTNTLEQAVTNSSASNIMGSNIARPGIPPLNFAS